jgi:hypothetical protein
MHSCRIEQLEQRAVLRAVARTGTARRPLRADDELGEEPSIPVECVTAEGVNMFCRRLSE